MSARGILEMSLYGRIKKLCDTNNIKVETLAKDILGIGETSIYRWDKNSPAIDKVAKVAEYFNVPTDYLLYGFNRAAFATILNYLKNKRTVEQFSVDTEIDLDELTKLLSGTATEPPDIETVEKIVSDNKIEYVVSNEDIYLHSGYKMKQTNVSSDVYKNEQLQELLRIFNNLDIKNKTSLLSYAYDLEDKINNKRQ